MAIYAETLEFDGQKYTMIPPVAKPDLVGGVKPKATKTANDTVPISIDSDGALYAPAYPTYEDATTTQRGFMSPGDKTNLDNAVAKLNTTGLANGIATLDGAGKVPISQLPSYVDDVIEAENKNDFPKPGETDKIYIDTATNLTYRWSGSTYVEISQSLALGETSSTAFAGDKGKAAYEHSQAAHAPSNAEKNTIVGVQVNGSDVAIDSNRKVNVVVPSIPDSIKNPKALTVSLNGTAQTAYDGSAAVSFNITPSSIGAATSSHGTHVSYGTTTPAANGTASAGSASTVSRSDHVHPLQTTVSGNAGTATQLKTSRNFSITGGATAAAKSFNGSADVALEVTSLDAMKLNIASTDTLILNGKF